jgi:putative Holliday junction resolvase
MHKHLPPGCYMAAAAIRPEFQLQAPEPVTGAAPVDETVIAFDFGTKRIGVAVGERRLGSARALQTIAVEGNDGRFAAIEQLCAEWHPARFVVGLPCNEDGSPHDMTARCERFANQLRGRFGLPVDSVDERFSSLEAERELKAPSRQRRLSWRERKQQLDAEAARIILQCWMDSHAATT